MKKTKPVRLERGDGDARVFWEIARDGTAVRTRYGARQNAGRTSAAKEYASAKEAEAVMADAIAAKHAEGYAKPVTRGESGVSSRKGVSARNPELEAAIEADLTDASAYLVYADWLQQQGDPRGELIVVQNRIADEAGARFERDERELFKKFSSELLGPFARHTFMRHSMRSFRTFSWRHGFIRGARLGPLVYTRLDMNESLAALLAHPSARFLEHLLLGRPSAAILRTLRERAPRTLRSLVVGDCASEPSSLAGVWEALPRLERLLTVGRVTSFGDFFAPELETFSFTAADPGNLPALLRANAPKLRSLRIALTAPVEASDVAGLLRRFPALEHFGVQRWTVLNDRGRTRLVPEDGLASAIAPYARHLRRLDLEMPLSEHGVDRILARAADLREIETLGIPRKGVPNGLHAQIEAALPNIAWTDDPEVEELDLLDIDVR